MTVIIRAGAHQTQAYVVVAVVRVVVVTVRNLTVVRVVVPAAATFNAVRPRRGANFFSASSLQIQCMHTLTYIHTSLQLLFSTALWRSL